MKKRPLGIPFFFLSLLLIASAARAQAQTTPTPTAPPDMDAYVGRVLKEFDVPGISVAIVKDGKVVMTKGYGVRKTGEPTPVNEHTLFGIASNTKAFTAAALAMLVDEGKLAWDDPVTKYLPNFQMYDAYVTRELTIRDLLTHRSGLGLGAGDLMFWPNTTFTREEIMHRIRYLKPASGFRSRYAYDNVLYLVAGQIVPVVTGKSWDDFIKERIFEPLEMTESNVTIKALKPGMNVVSPHTEIENRVTPIPFNDLDNGAPAGAINSNAVDMAKWVVVQLDRGLVRASKDGKQRLFSERQSRAMWAVTTPLTVNDPPAELAALKANYAGYGLGWSLGDYRGRKTVSHTGGLAGMVSRVMLIPEINAGVVVLTNQEQGGAFNSVALHVMDYYLNAPETDWTKAFRTVAERGVAQAKATEQAQRLTRNDNSKPSLPLDKYAGKYRDVWYGDVSIALEEGKPVLRLAKTPGMVGDLEHWQYDTFIARWRDRSLHADAYVYFALKPDGSIDNMKMLAVSPLTDFSFDFHDLYFLPVK
ncbi:MAG TPA: serine hydrolase [Pyrinomonadaceae bacterium]|nr:serine hydrolase [Pyrinomonadaceae bacterium]